VVLVGHKPEGWDPADNPDHGLVGNSYIPHSADVSLHKIHYQDHNGDWHSTDADGHSVHVVGGGYDHVPHHGAKGMTRTCPTCHGNGVNVEEPYEDEEGDLVQSEPTECDDCQGRGTVEGLTSEEEEQERQRHRQTKSDRVAQHMRAWHSQGEGVGAACTYSCPVVQEGRRTAANEPPSVSGVALKAADTGRVLMLQRGLHDEDDPAGGSWEFPGGHHEDGDRTSLDAGIREWEEETGHPFPEGGVVHHTWTSPNGIYQGHVVVIPEEGSVQFGNGRSVVNPDNPDGDQHEQAAWWDPDHARKNPALREELKTGTPWKEIKAAGTAKTAATADPLYGLEEASPLSPPQHSNSTNPASTGWATTQDPHSWDDPENNATNLGALPGDGFLGNLHDKPEAALPSTDGAESELDNERQDAGVGQYDENDAELTPNTTLASAGSAQDIVARFQATAAAQALGGGEAGHHAAQQANNKEIAHAAKEFLSKQALKDFNYAEQQALINEGARDKSMARNSDALNIQDTHYAALEAALAAEDALEDSAELFA
jgi:8-oxo-dGTP pyrophosphatase MutT (NUDIX family)